VDDAITELELAAAGHWRGTAEERLGGWLLRAADGFTGRANSALAVGDPGMPLEAAIDAVTDWYRARALPPMIAVPMPLGEEAAPPHSLDSFLAEQGWPARSAPAFVMVAEASGTAGPLRLPSGTGLVIAAEPDDAWLAMYHYRGQDDLPPVARRVLLSAPWQGFASIRDEARAVVAIARLSVGGGWAENTAVEVSPARRRQGLGTMITHAACAEGARRGVRRVFLQVEVDNAAAQAMYERCGFRYSHRYHYRVGAAA